MRKDLARVVQGLSVNISFFVRFVDGCEKYLTPNQLAVLTLDRIPVT